MQNIQTNDFGTLTPNASSSTVGIFDAQPDALASTNSDGDHVWVGCLTSNGPLLSISVQGVQNMTDASGGMLPLSDVAIGVTNDPGGAAPLGCAITPGQSQTGACTLPVDGSTVRTLVGEAPAGTTELDWQYQLSLPANQPTGAYSGGEVLFTATAGTAQSPSAPINTAAPALSSTNAQEGAALSVSTGMWSANPTSYAYQWEACSGGGGCTAISGAVNSSYTPSAPDVGKTLRVVVTATAAGGSTSAYSNSSNTVGAATPVNAAAPALSPSNPRQGVLERASTGTWLGNPTSYSYQWQQCTSTGSGCTDISGAGSSTYTPVAADVAHTLRVRVTATNAHGSTSANSSTSAAVQSPASACTVTWTGPATGNWQTPGNWSTDAVPDSSDVACVGPSSSVEITTGTNQAYLLRDEGHLLLSGGSLELTSNSEVSEVAKLSLAGGTLGLAGELAVSSTTSVTGNPVTVSGGGRLVLETGTSTTIGSGKCSAHLALTGVALVNQGTLTFGESAGVGAGAIAMQNGAQIINEGTFIDRSYDDSCGYGVGGSNYSIYGTSGTFSATNTGTFTAETGTTTLNIDIPFNNQGTVKVSSGTLQFQDGGTSAGGTWTASSGTSVVYSGGSDTLTGDTWTGAGSVAIAGAAVSATKLQASGANVALNSGTLSIPEGPITTVPVLTLTGGTLSLSGELVIASTVTVTGGSSATVAGSGKLLLPSGATATIGSSACTAHLVLSGVTFVNQSTVTFGGSAGVGAGAIAMQNGAQIINEGTFIDRSYDSGCGFGIGGDDYTIYNPGSSSASVTNTGTFQVEGSNQTLNVNVTFNNLSTVNVVSGGLELTGGGTDSNGTWSIPSGTTLTFHSGSYSLTGDAWTGAGAVAITGGSVSATKLQASVIDLSVSSGSLTIPSGSTTTVNGLSLSGGTLSVSGELKTSSSFSATNVPTISGSGRVVVGLGVSGTIGSSASCSVHLILSGVTLVNQGTLTFGESAGVGAGAIAMQNGAQIINEGTFIDRSYDSACGYGLSGDFYTIYNPGSSGASITNTGTFIGEGGSVTLNVQVAFENQGLVLGQSGTLRFIGGGLTGQVASGIWRVQNSAAIVLGSGEFLIAQAVDLSAVRIEGATVKRVAVSAAPKGLLDSEPYVSGTATVSGSGESAGSGFAAAAIEVTTFGRGEWKPLCGPLTPTVQGTFSCAWNTLSGSYPEGRYQLRAQLSDSSNPPNTAATAAITVQVDNIAPSGTISVPSELHGPQIVSGTASDSVSGVSSWQVQIAREGSTQWLSACPAQATPTTGSTYQCTVEGFSYTDGVYQMRALITDGAGNTFTTAAASTRIDNQAPADTSPPLITGKAWTAQTLQASTGSWTGTEPLTYTYQWQSCNSHGEACSDISGATSSSYVVKGGDLGNTLRVLVGATNPLGTSTSSSATTAAVVESSCTDIFKGASGGTWQASGNWSAGIVPGPADIACVPAGTTVDVTAGTNQTGSLRDQGGLAISGGSLEVANGLETATVNSLSLSGGTLTLAAELDVSGSFTGTGSGHPTITGAGRLVLQPSSTDVIDSQACGSGGGDFFLSGIDLLNEGVLTFGSSSGSADGDLVMSSGAQIQNSGTLNADTYSNDAGPCNNTNYSFISSGSSAPSITNTGTLNANPGTGHTVLSNVSFDNQGSVQIVSGTLQLTGGGSGSSSTWSAASGTVLSFAGGSFGLSADTFSGSGTIGVAGATVSATSLQATAGSLTLSSGTFTIPTSSTSSISNVTLTSGTLSVAGELDVGGSFTGTGSGHPTISGSGQLVLQPASTDMIDSQTCGSGGGDFFLSAINLINQGTLTFGTTGTADGDIVMSNGAQIQNSGTLNANTYSNDVGPCNHTNYSFFNNGGTTPAITNSGTLNANPGTGHTILTNVPFNNQGITQAESGKLELTGGGVSEQVALGSWNVLGSGKIVLGAGKFLVGQSVDLSAVQLTGATIERR